MPIARGADADGTDVRQVGSNAASGILVDALRHLASAVQKTADQPVFVSQNQVNRLFCFENHVRKTALAGKGSVNLCRERTFWGWFAGA
jgi:hypothetical protein